MTIMSPDPKDNIPGQNPMPDLEKGRVEVDENKVQEGILTKDSVQDVEVDFTLDNEDEDNENQDQKNKNGGRTLDEHS